MITYTPINKFKLTQKGRELLENIDKWVRWYQNEKIVLNDAEFELLLMAIPPNRRNDFKDVIPYMGKNIMRS